MKTLQQQLRQQQKDEELCSTTVRALSAHADLNFRGGKLYKGLRRHPLFASHLQYDTEGHNYASYRGISDGIAQRFIHTDETLHRKLCPSAPIERLIFELLEQLRAESLVANYLPGVQHNLKQHFKHWSLQFHYTGLSESALGILLYTLAQISWARLNSWQVLEETEDFIEATRAGIVPLIGNDLAGIKKQREHQREFAHHAISIASTIHDLIQQATPEQNEDDDDNDIETDASLKLLLNFAESEDEGVASALSGKSKVFAEADASYQIFSKQYDKELVAGTLVRPELLTSLREQLDTKISEHGVNITRLARQLSAIFALPQRDGWLFGEEDGIIDGSRLSQLVSSPTERRLFKQEKYTPKANAIVSILIDCSGSMKQHIESVAVLIDSLARAMDLAGIRSEVLGFTTGAWNGGRIMQEWMVRGRPKNPGRLNEVNHLIYKDIDSTWHHSRRNIASMLKPDLFREGIDGEAVSWACKRLQGREAWRKILLVISDGCPMDTATNLANDQYYLDNHLKQVITQQNQQSDIEIFGVGVGLDLSPFYSNSVAIDLSKSLTRKTFDEILQMFSKKPHYK